MQIFFLLWFYKTILKLNYLNFTSAYNKNIFISAQTYSPRVTFFKFFIKFMYFYINSYFFLDKIYLYQLQFHEKKKFTRFVFSLWQIILFSPMTKRLCKTIASMNTVIWFHMSQSLPMVFSFRDIFSASFRVCPYLLLLTNTLPCRMGMEKL